MTADRLDRLELLAAGAIAALLLILVAVQAHHAAQPDHIEQMTRTSAYEVTP